MKLIQLTAENFKRLEAVELRPSPEGLTIIAGDNAQGKSSLLDAIAAAIGGGRSTPEQPIRTGAKRAVVIAELDDLTVTRTFTPSGGQIVVEAKEGGKLAKPQAVLDKLYDALAFDPLAFVASKPAEQAAMVSRAAGLQLDDLAAERKEAYDERTVVNRDLKREQAALEKMPAPFVTDAEVRAVDEVQQELDSATRVQQQAEICNTRLFALDAEEERLQKQIADLAKRREALHVEFNTLPVVTSAATDALRAELKIARAVAASVSERKAVNAVEVRVANLSHESEQLSKRIEDLDAERTKRLAAVKMPIADLEITTDGALIYCGVPLSQASQAEQLRVSVAVGMALKPELRLFLVRDGSLMDDKSMMLLSELAAQYHAQVLVERVGSDTGGCGVVIEEGRVRKIEIEGRTIVIPKLPEKVVMIMCHDVEEGAKAIPCLEGCADVSDCSHLAAGGKWATCEAGGAIK